ncbi:hypothetical protein N7445_001078 [Penicillium cf. griseofulvum]|nr:hypothetical protein N7445_001078 [Penicillium cf. griseofulvum]
MPSRGTVLVLVLVHITAIITIVRGWRALYRWGMRGWSWFCARPHHVALGLVLQYIHGGIASASVPPG